MSALRGGNWWTNHRSRLVNLFTVKPRFLHDDSEGKFPQKIDKPQKINETKLDKLFRQRNVYERNKIQFDTFPQRPLLPEDQYHVKALLGEEKDIGNDERCIGPYPRTDMDYKSFCSREGNEREYDFPISKRNFGEPVPYYYDFLATEMPDYMEDTPFWQSFLVISGLASVIGGIIWIAYWLDEKYGQKWKDAGYAVFY